MVLAAIPSLLAELGEVVDVVEVLVRRPGVGIREILLGVRNLELGTRPDVEMARRDLPLPSIDSLSSVFSSAPLVTSWIWRSDSAGYSGAGSNESMASRPTASCSSSMDPAVCGSCCVSLCSRFQDQPLVTHTERQQVLVLFGSARYTRHCQARKKLLLKCLSVVGLPTFQIGRAHV